jgi:hypothetical protein
MLRATLATTALVTVWFLSVPIGASHPLQAGSSSFVAYDEFMKTNPSDRHARFASLSSDNKALIVRTHGERWLARNRARLGTTEIAVFEEMIRFITPDRYRKRGEAGVDKAEQTLLDRLRCRVNVGDVTEAFNVFSTAKPSAEARWRYLGQAKCWVQWIAEDLIEYVPSVRR